MRSSCRRRRRMIWFIFLFLLPPCRPSLSPSYCVSAYISMSVVDYCLRVRLCRWLLPLCPSLIVVSVISVSIVDCCLRIRVRLFIAFDRSAVRVFVCFLWSRSNPIILDNIFLFFFLPWFIIGSKSFLFSSFLLFILFILNFW